MVWSVFFFLTRAIDSYDLGPVLPVLIEPFDHIFSTGRERVTHHYELQATIVSFDSYFLLYDVTIRETQYLQSERQFVPNNKFRYWTHATIVVRVHLQFLRLNLLTEAL